MWESDLVAYRKEVANGNTAAMCAAFEEWVDETNFCNIVAFGSSELRDCFGMIDNTSTQVTCAEKLGEGLKRDGGSMTCDNVSSILCVVNNISSRLAILEELAPLISDGRSQMQRDNLMRCFDENRSTQLMAEQIELGR